MKITLFCLLAIPTSLLLTQCADVVQELDNEIVREEAAEARQNHRNHAERNNTNTSGHPTYGVGFEKGRADGMKGLSRTPDRYSYIYSEADRSQFFNGYEEGYNVGIQ